MKVRFHPGARRDLTDGYHWYEDRSDRAASRFIEEVSATLDCILEAPDRFRPVAPGSKFRTVTLDDFPYNLIYRVIAGGIVVIAVAHEKRRPGYWLRRID